MTHSVPILKAGPLKGRLANLILKLKILPQTFRCPSAASSIACQLLIALSVSFECEFFSSSFLHAERYSTHVNGPIFSGMG